MAVSFISLNIEGDNHLDLVVPFLQQSQADIICLQEVFKCNLDDMARQLNMQAVFVPITQITQSVTPFPRPLGELGMAILSKWPMSNQQSEVIHWYDRNQVVPVHQEGEPNSANRAVMWADVLVDSQPWTIATTHFTWSPQASFTPEQATSLELLLAALKPIPEFILCGDLNSPRTTTERNVFTTLAELYHDAIPEHYTTSLDPQLHKAGRLEYMVDGLFTTPKYHATQVKLVDGVSDHMAIVAQIKKVARDEE